MKPFLSLVLLLLSTLLTACPSVQAPPPAINFTGDWSGTLIHNDGQNAAIPLTATLTQTESTLGGPASLSPVPGLASGEVTGDLSGSNATFAFSFVAAVEDVDGVVTETIGTYTFSGALSGNTLSGDFVATADGSDFSLPGSFTLERQ